MSESTSCQNSLIIPFFITFLLSSIIVFPGVSAQVEWEEDGWLKTSLAQERLQNGDEFGCYGMEGLSWNADPGAVALECRTYIEDRVIANQWGNHPISTFTPPGLSVNQHDVIAEQGFVVHGDNTDLLSSAWHSANDTPMDSWDWYNLGRRGGSLEQIVGSKEQVKDAVEQGGLVNLYWIGRVNDATIRHDKDIEQYITEEANAWLTTWGQAWSYWSASKCYQFDHEITESDGEFILKFESLITEQCQNLNPERWNVPLTWKIDIGDSRINSIIGDSGQLENISEAKTSREGYFHNQNQYLHLTVVNGNRVNISINASDYDVVGMSEFWNNKTTAITIAAHETTDLFKWSKRFVDKDGLVFTWLVQPRPAQSDAPWIPYVALGLAATAVLAMMIILKKEGLGPLAKNSKDYQAKINESE